VIDPKDNTTQYQYDGANNLTKIIDAYSKESVNTYDALYHRTDSTDPLGHVSHTDFDGEHHPFRSTTYPAPGNPVSSESAYFPNGLGQTAKDGRKVVTSFTYDAYGNPDTKQTASFPAIDYTFDPIGRMTGLKDQAGSQTTFVYDKRGLLLSRLDPLLKSATSTYYDDGTVHTKTDRNNQTISYDYTNSGKLGAITYPNSAVTSYTYDLRDNLTQRQDSLGTTGLSYDALNRITTLTDPRNFSTGYEYDATGNVTKITYPGNKTISYTYDALNRLATVSIDWLGKTATYHYDDAGRLTGLDQFNGTSSQYTYDNANRLTDLQTLTAPSVGQVIAAYHFTLDGNGNRIHSSQTTPQALTVADESLAMTYNATKNRLLTAGASNFSYDNEGQLATKNSDGFTFDYEHRLTAISGAMSGQFKYDGAGNRLEASWNGTTTRYVYDVKGNLIAEADSNNIISRYYIYGAGLMAMVTSNGELYCYHFDATGHTVALTNASKGLVNKYAYTPYGIIANQTETMPQPFKYAGQHGVMAEPNGLYYMRARYYDPQVGRFLSEDSLGFEGGDLNLYAYVGNSPIMGVDPSGLCVQSGIRSAVDYMGGKQMLTNFGTMNAVAVAASSETIIGPLVFGTMGTTSVALKQYLYSENAWRDSIQSSVVRTLGSISNAYPMVAPMAGEVINQINQYDDRVKKNH
ncbi:MAG: hypothetical protein PHI06_12350, partial [Desulfobulbaceae bacterium]|nr:hypothetical protein [Desulfobulbaceae bacterium]